MLPGRAGARRVRAAFHGYARAACEHTCRQPCREYPDGESAGPRLGNRQKTRSEEHTSNSSHLVISYAVFCLKKKKILQFLPAQSQRIKVGTGAFCDTQQQMERFVALFDGHGETAVNSVNAAAKDPSSCGFGTVAYVR